MQKSISRYETGVSLPSLEMLERIAKALKKPFAYFLDEEFNDQERIREFFLVQRPSQKRMESMLEVDEIEAKKS
jgi:transcriptional regulator with XRE-family HTH domain